MENAGESITIFVLVGFQARNRIDSQTHDNATFDRLPFSNAVYQIGSEKSLLMESSVIMI